MPNIWSSIMNVTKFSMFLPSLPAINLSSLDAVEVVSSVTVLFRSYAPTKSLDDFYRGSCLAYPHLHMG